MSAYVVDPTHIDVMLSVAINGPKGGVWPSRWIAPGVYELLEGDEHTGPITREIADSAGRVLMAECIAAVAYSYDEPPGVLPGPIPNPDPDLYEWTDFGRFLTPVEALRAIDGFVYQSCEHPGWWDSGAHRFCQRLRKALIHCLPGYEGAEWHWTTEKTLARASRRGGE